MTPTPTPTPDRLLTLKDVARILDMDYKYVHDLKRAGHIPYIQRAPGCAIRVKLSTLRRIFPERLSQRDA